MRQANKTHFHECNRKFIDVNFSQELKGKEKYGEPLNPHNKNYDWLEMAIEEVVDGFKYLHAEQVKRERIVAKIREIIQYNTNILAHDQISALLDQLEGKHG